ncbi:MAG TPA: hypothetical protein PKH01_08355, partial [Pseudomonadales bacterium]|nr:hypothetical protein [Pseudomonadales bacterium]
SLSGLNPVISISTQMRLLLSCAIMVSIFLNVMRLIVSYRRQCVTFKQTGEMPVYFAVMI